MKRGITTTEFISKSRLVHKDTYDYSLVEIKPKERKVTIICKHHGAFTQRIDHHLNGHGCSRCANVNFKDEK